MRSFSQQRVRVVLLTLSLGALWLVACGDDRASSGHDTPEDVLAAHIEAGRTYDLAAGCRLRPPEQLEQFATADAVDVDGYCDFATEEVMAMADQATKARSEAIYTDPVVEPLTRSGGQWFRITSTDGSYEEEVMVVERDGRWYVGEIEAHLHDDEEAHLHDDEDDHDHDEMQPEEGGGDEVVDDQSGTEDQPG